MIDKESWLEDEKICNFQLPYKIEKVELSWQWTLYVFIHQQVN